MAGVTQDAVRPGGELQLPAAVRPAGDLLVPPHQRGREGITRGLYGALVVQPATGSGAGVDLVLPFHIIGSTTILADSDQMRCEVVPAGTPVRLRLSTPTSSRAGD